MSPLFAAVALLSALASPSRADAPAERVDASGDPLPADAIRRIGSLRFRHGGLVRTLLPCPDGKTLISSDVAGSRTVCVWDLASGRLLRRFPGSRRGWPPALSPDGKRLAIGDEAGTVHLYDFASGRELRQFKGQRIDLLGLGFSPDGKMLVSSGPREILLWDAATGAKLATIAVPLDGGDPLLAFSPDGKTLFAGQGFHEKAHVYDVATRREIRTIARGNRLRPMSLALSSDGKMLAMGSGDGRGGGDGLIPLWDAGSGQLIRNLHSKKKTIVKVAFSPDGKLLATGNGGFPPLLTLWDVAAGKVRHSWEEPANSLAFSRDGKMLLVGGSVIRRFDTTTGKEIPAQQSNQFAIDRLALFPDGKTLAAPDAVAVHLWDAETGKPLRSIAADGELLLRLALSPDGRTLVASSHRGALRWFDAATGKMLRVRYSPLIDTPRDPETKGEYLTGIAFSPDGQTLATSGWEGSVALWDARSGEQRHRFRWPEVRRVEAVAFTDNGSRLWAAFPTGPDPRTGQHGTQLRAWDVSRAEELPRLTAAMNARLAKLEASRLYPPSARIAVSPGGHMLAVNRGKTISVWETASGQERLCLKGQDDATLCAAFSPDGRLLASAARDDTFRLWDLAGGTKLAQLTGHRGQVNALIFSPDGKRLYSAGADTTILITDAGRIARRSLHAVPAVDAETTWKDLASADAAQAYRAMHSLRAHPATALPLFAKHLRPVPAVEANRLVELIHRLDADEFEQREAASRELEKLGAIAEPALRRALRQDPSLEMRRRTLALLDKLVLPSADVLRSLRAVEVLEQIGDAEARRLLEKLAAGAAEARLTREAKAALSQRKTQIE